MILLHPRSLTGCPSKMVVGRRSFPIGKVTFQGRTVQLWESICLLIGAYIYRIPNYPPIYQGTLSLTHVPIFYKILKKNM